MVLQEQSALESSGLDKRACNPQAKHWQLLATDRRPKLDKQKLRQTDSVTMCFWVHNKPAVARGPLTL
jgi:hypothetical protein